MSVNLAHILVTAARLQQQGLTPSVALLKAKLGGKVPLPLLIEALQRFKNMTDAEVSALVNTAQSGDSVIPSTASADMTTLAQLLQQVVQLQQRCEQLELRVQQLENKPLEQH